MPACVTLSIGGIEIEGGLKTLYVKENQVVELEYEDTFVYNDRATYHSLVF